MRFPAATSNSGMLTKWRPAIVITASSSGCGREPPSIVIVPSQLITVVTPSSSYGFPVCPKPFTGALAPAEPRFVENNLRGAKSDPAITPALPRKLRRFHLDLNRIKVTPWSLLAGYRGDAIDFHQRISRQGSHRDRRARWPAMGKVCREHLVHSVPVFNFHQIDIQLENAVHSSPANFYVLLNLIHDHAGVG